MRAPRTVLPIVAAAALVAGATTTSAATKPTLKVSPAHVHRGGHIAFSGSHWGRHKTVTLFLGRPGATGMNKITDVKTDGKGHFSFAQPIRPTAPTGAYLIIACRKSCEIKVSKPWEIL